MNDFLVFISFFHFAALNQFDSDFETDIESQSSVSGLD